MTALIIDVETTGGDANQVIELAAMTLDGEPVVDQLYKPSCPITCGALAVHHILPSDLEGKPPSSQVSIPLCDYIIGHNIDFDWKAIGSPPVKRMGTQATHASTPGDG